MSDHLQTKLAGARRLQTAGDLVAGLARVAACVLVAAMAAMAADWWFDLAMPVRVALLLANVGLAGYAGFCWVARPLQSPADEDTMALRMEHGTPELRSRLIVAVQLARVPGLAQSSLVRKLMADAEAKELDFTRAVRWRPAALFAAVAVAVLMLFGALYQKMKPASGDLVRRFFLASIPVPRKTRVECVTGNCVVAKGDPLAIEAVAHGVVPAGGGVTLEFESGRSESFTMLPGRGERARFRRGFANVQESFTYRVKLNDGVSAPFQVEAHPRPALAGLQCTQIWPAYTGQKATRRALGDLVLLAGSRLELEGVATKTLTQAVARLSGVEAELPLTVSGKNLRGTLTVPSKGLSGFAVGLRDEEGLRSKNEVEYRVEIVPDKSPVVRLTSPVGREELVTPSGMVWVAFEAEDDFGIADVAIHYKTDREAKEQVIALDLNGEQPKTVRRRYEWKMSAVAPPAVEGTTIEFWVQAMDSNDVTGPGVTVTEHRFLKVVSEMEKRAELMGRLEEYLGQLGAVADSQLKLNQSLGEIIREKPATTR